MTNAPFDKLILRTFRLALLFAIALFAYKVSGQSTLEVKTPLPVGTYDIVPKGTVPPDTTGCQCKDGEPGAPGLPGKDGRGIVSTVVDPTTGIMTVTYTDGSKYISSSLIGPPGKNGTDGVNGVCPSCPPNGGSGPYIRGVFNVMDWGAKADGISDDGPAFTAAIAANRGIRGSKMIVPPPVNFYNIRTTIQAIPDGSNQLWMELEYMGGPGSMRWLGADGGVMWRIIGLKGSDWEGINAAIEQGKTGVTLFDIDATSSAQSSSFNTFHGFYLNLGNRSNNVAFRLGHISGGSADISDYHFDHCTIIGNEGGVPQPGQIAYLVEGVNTLACEVIGGFVAWCSNVFSNKSLPGATSSRGNSGTAYFTNVHTSQNIVDYSFHWEGTYVISGIRAESSRDVFETGVGVGFPSITFIGCRFNDYKGNQVGTLNCAASVEFINCQFHRQGSPFPQMFTINSNGNSGTIRVMNGATHYNTLYTKTGNTVWKMYMEGVGRWSGPYANFTSPQLIPDINGQQL